MGLTMKEKRSLAALKAVGYRQARKPEKTKRLDELVALTQYTRRYCQLNSKRNKISESDKLNPHFVTG
jgi:hypothetical protein